MHFLVVTIVFQVWLVGVTTCLFEKQGNNFQRRLHQDDVCGDVSPDESPFGCEQYAALGLCNAIQNQYCQKSCKRCCEDVLPIGMANCSAIIFLDLCDNPKIRGLYCNAACGNCNFQGPAEFLPSPESLPDDCDLMDALKCDREALLAFKNTVTAGEFLLSTWSGENPCVWRFVSCTKIDDVNYRVTRLDMDFAEDEKNKYTLFGSITLEFSKIRYMKELSIAAQNITGKLYNEFSVLKNLEGLNIYRTQLSGTIPKQYSSFKNLNSFTTSFNGLSGKIPMEFSEWSFMDFFSIAKNQLTGNLPVELSAWSAVWLVSMRSNELTGTLPPEFSTWEKLVHFYGYENQFQGFLSPEYSAISRIQYFLINSNQFSGNLPVEFSSWSDIYHFNVSNNQLSGTLPTEFSVLSDMTLFAVQNNQFSGNLLPQISAWKKITNFEAGGNLFSGSLPPDYSALNNLQIFLVNNNDALNGVLPVQYSALINLIKFDSSSTSIEDTIPQEWNLLSFSAEINV